jgi:hypothetical protein
MTKIKKFQLFIILFFITNSYAQEYFKGIVNYKISYESLNENIPVNFFEIQIGTSMTAYVKEDRYAMIYHGKGELGWTKTIVRLDEGYTYTEYEKNDTIVKEKFGSQEETLIEFKRNKNDKKIILDESCESITLIHKSNDPDEFFAETHGKYYFNPKYKLNPKHYKNYTDGFWNLYVKESEAISLRNEIELRPLLKAIQEAESISQENIPKKIFEPNKEKVIIIKD